MSRVTAPPVLQGPPVSGDHAPLDYLVVQLPDDCLDLPTELARELAALVDAEMIRVLDLVLVRRHLDGDLTVLEPGDLGRRDLLRHVEAGLRVVLSGADVVRAAALVEPGSSAVLVVWEAVWTEPLVESARASGGRLLGGGLVAADPDRLATD